MALGQLLSNIFKFRDTLGDAEEDADEKELDYYQENMEKFDYIQSRISAELVPLVDEERTMAEEEMVLNRIVCIALKFHEVAIVARQYSIINVKTFDKMPLNTFMDCTQKEMENSLKRYL
jgi:hypothetical protein